MATTISTPTTNSGPAGTAGLGINHPQTGATRSAPEQPGDNQTNNSTAPDGHPKPPPYRRFSFSFKRDTYIYIAKDGQSQKPVEAKMRIDSDPKAINKISHEFLHRTGIQITLPESSESGSYQPTQDQKIPLKWSPKSDHVGYALHEFHVTPITGADVILTKSTLSDCAANRKSWLPFWNPKLNYIKTNEEQNEMKLQVAKEEMQGVRSEIDWRRQSRRAVLLAQDAEAQGITKGPPTAPVVQATRPATISEQPQAPVEYAMSGATAVTSLSPSSMASGFSAAETVVQSPVLQQMQASGEEKPVKQNAWRKLKNVFKPSKNCQMAAY